MNRLLVSRGLLMVWIRDALAESSRRTAGWLAMQQVVRNTVETDKEISWSREREADVGRVYHMEQDEEREREVLPFEMPSSLRQLLDTWSK
uniref:Uncharacterized protein n=1 Tax=Peronospora matthiolae TaxID=2874970 RepID=A0AAV1UUM9_9STRA